MKHQSVKATKAILAILVCFFEVNTATASTVTCNGYVTIPGSFITGSCMNGHCTAYSGSNNVSVYGSCANGISFNASAFMSGSYISTQCNNGSFYVFTNAQTLNWMGSCSNGGRLYIPTTMVMGSNINGQCSNDGSFSGFSAPVSISVSAQCN